MVTRRRTVGKHREIVGREILVSLVDLGQKGVHGFGVHLLGGHVVKTTIPGTDGCVFVLEET